MIGGLMNLFGLGGNRSGRYEMAEDRNQRRAPRPRKASEDAVFHQKDRDRGTATIYDLIRNDPVASWALGKFLDYVTVAYFAGKSGDAALDDAVEQAVAEWCLAKNCDVAARNDFDSLIRIVGTALALDGDAALLKVNGVRLQGIESDRLRSTGDRAPDPVPGARLVNGVWVDPDTGRAVGYALYNRGENGVGYAYNRTIAPEDLIFVGNFSRFDQVRGVPLVAPSATTFQDVKEIDLYQLLKVKNHAQIGLAITSKSGSGLDSFAMPLAAPVPTGEEEAGAAEEGTALGVQPFDLTTPLKLELEPGDEVNTIESHTPSNEYQSFSEMQIRKALLAFGISFSFFDSRSSSYSAMKQDRSEFKFFIQRFQRMMLELRTEVTRWALPSICRRAGITLPDHYAFEWLPQAEPWLEEDREVKAAIERVAAGFSSVEIECKRRGLDAYDVLRSTARLQNYIRRSGAVVSVGTPGTALFNSDKMSNNSTATPAASGSGAPPPAAEPGAAEEPFPNDQPQEGNR